MPSIVRSALPVSPKPGSTSFMQSPQPSVFKAPERTPRTADQPPATRGARRRPGSNRRATRRSSSNDRAPCQFKESRSRRPWIQPATRLATVPRGLRWRTCAPPRRMVGVDCPLGRSSGEARAEDFERFVHAVAPCSGSASALRARVSLSTARSSHISMIARERPLPTLFG